MRKLNRLIAAGALAVPMALGASGIAMAAEEDSSGPLGLGEELQEGDESSDGSESEGDSARDEGDSTRDEGDSTRDAGSDLRDELLEIGRELRGGSDEENSDDENSNESSSNESSSNEESDSEEESDFDLLGMGGGNFEDNGGGLFGGLG